MGDDSETSQYHSFRRQFESFSVLEHTIQRINRFFEDTARVGAESAFVMIDDLAYLMKERALMRWLCDEGYLAKVANMEIPLLEHINSELFEAESGALVTVTGRMETITSLITGKGQIVLLDALRHEFGTTTKDEEDTNHG